MLGAHIYSHRQKSYYSLVGSECSQTMMIYYLIVWESDIKKRPYIGSVLCFHDCPAKNMYNRFKSSVNTH